MEDLWDDYEELDYEYTEASSVCSGTESVLTEIKLQRDVKVVESIQEHKTKTKRWRHLNLLRKSRKRICCWRIRAFDPVFTTVTKLPSKKQERETKKIMKDSTLRQIDTITHLSIIVNNKSSPIFCDIKPECSVQVSNC